MTTKGPLNKECKFDLNHFSYVLPAHHNQVGCHNESQRRRRVICQMKNAINQLDCLPVCEGWNEGTKGIVQYGVYQQTNGKPWEPDRVKSNELVGGRMQASCTCFRRNGLQDDCRMTQCQGKPWCQTVPYPTCPPFTKVPQEYIPPNPYEVCPNVPDGKVMVDVTRMDQANNFGTDPGWTPTPGAGNVFPKDIFMGNECGSYRLHRIEQPNNKLMYELDPSTCVPNGCYC